QVNSEDEVTSVLHALCHAVGLLYFLFNHAPTAMVYTLSLHDALPISGGSLPYVAHLGYAHARNGDRAKAEQALSDLMELSGQKYVSPYDFAVIHAAVGNNDEAFKWLEKAYEQRTSRLTELADPGFKALRADPRFQPLRRCIGLP